MNYETLKKLLSGTGLTDLFLQSCVKEDNDFCKIIEEYKPARVIEIGTLNGLSTAVISEYADLVLTFDIVSNPIRGKVWRCLGYDNIIQFIESAEKIRNLITETVKGVGLKFDTAVIDAVHDYDNVKKDWETVNFCDVVIFHDAHFKGVENFMKEIGAEFYGREFAVWKKS